MFYRTFLIFVSIALLYVTISSAQELTIYTMPAPKGVNWQSPRKLIMSYIGNALMPYKYHGIERHSIGHVVIELKDSTRYALVGETAVSNRYMMHKIMHRGWGIGLLFATVDGMIEEADINAPQIAKREENGNVAFVTYAVNAAVFERLWQYLQEYKRRGYGKYYNGKNNPRGGEGAGCSAFAYSFLEVGGLKKIIREDEWISHIAVQESLIGGPESDSRRVSFIMLFLRGKWADTTRNQYRHLYIYEPTFMFNSITTQWASAPDTGIIHRMMYKKAKGLMIDATKIAPPDEPVWLNRAATQ